MRIFLSYNFRDEWFAELIYYFLKKQPQVNPYCYAHDRKSGKWSNQIGEVLRNCETFLLLRGDEAGEIQIMEAQIAIDLRENIRNQFHIALTKTDIPDELLFFCRGEDHISVPSMDENGAAYCAREVVERLGSAWVPLDGLPLGYPFDYEKDIIDAYLRGKGQLSHEYIAKGCTPNWPIVEKQPADKQNPVKEPIIGSYRPEDAGIIVSTRTKYPPRENGEEKIRDLSFPEAGPRKNHRYPTKLNRTLRVGVLVSGGIAPGINAVIDGIVSRHKLYAMKLEDRHKNQTSHDGQLPLEINGYTEGFKGLLTPGHSYIPLIEKRIETEAGLGGTRLITSRAEDLLDEDFARRGRSIGKIVDRLANDGVEILYIIGGDGSMRAAHAIWMRAQEENKNIAVVGIPKTMDNDILWVWQSFGFLSAVEKAKEAALNLHTEARSNPRLCVLQLFGSDSGFVVSHTALSSGVCDAVLMPEVEFTMEGLICHIKNVLKKRYIPNSGDVRPYGLIIMSETAIPLGAERYFDDHDIGLSPEEIQGIKRFIQNDRRVYGQTPDALRTAGLKIVSRILQKAIKEMGNDDPYWKTFRIFTNEPRHLIRSIPPSVSDVIYGQRLGTLAVDNAMAGYTDFMVSNWLTEFVLVPLRLVVLGRKRMPDTGIFWKSVLASTSQPESMK